jgi:hypothetical protein
MKKSKSVVKYHEELKKTIISMQAECEAMELAIKSHYMIYANNWNTFYDITKDTRKKLEEYRRLIEYYQDELGDNVYLNTWVGSDCYAYEVVEMVTPCKWIIRQLDTKLTQNGQEALSESFIPGGFMGHYDNDCQEWEYISNENNPTYTVTRHSKTSPFCCWGSKSYPENEPIRHHDYNF